MAAMSTLDEVKSWLAEQLPALIEKYDVPGAAVAVLAGGEVVDGAAGVLNKATGVEATADSLFQIGSITKLWTSTLVMQLVDEGKVDLDVPVRTYLPEFKIGDEAAAAQITTRQLLNHTVRLRGRHLHRHRRRRRLRREVPRRPPRGAAAVPGRRAVLLQQRRLLRARPAGRGAPREAVRRVPARAPLRAARPHPRRDQPVRGDHVPRRRWATSSSSRAPATSPPRSGRWPAPTPPPARCSAMRPRDLLDVRRDAPRTTARPPTAPRCSRPAPPAGCTTARSTCPTSA